MSKASSRIQIDSRKVSSELFSLTYGALVAQLIHDFEDVDEVNKQLEKMGYNIGVRLIDDFLARSNTGRCNDLKEVADVIAENGFKMFLGGKAKVSNWSAAGDEFSLIVETNPLTEFVELPPDRMDLVYCNLLCGVLRGALESVHLECTVSIVRDQLKGDPATEIRIKYVRRLQDALPAGEDD